MKQAMATLLDITNVESNLVRAPYGSKPYVTPAFKHAADDDELILWDWNIDSVDWKFKKGEYVNRVIEQVNLLTDKEPLVILLHEKPSTLAYLETLLKYFKSNGYEMEALNETMQPIQFK